MRYSEEENVRPTAWDIYDEGGEIRGRVRRDGHLFTAVLLPNWHLGTYSRLETAARALLGAELREEDG